MLAALPLFLAVLLVLSVPALAEGVDLGNGLLVVDVTPTEYGRNDYHLSSSAVDLVQDGSFRCDPATQGVGVHCALLGTGRIGDVVVSPGGLGCGAAVTNRAAVVCSQGPWLNAGPLSEGVGYCPLVVGAMTWQRCYPYATVGDVGGLFCLDQADAASPVRGSGVCFVWADTPAGEVMVICSHSLRGEEYAGIVSGSAFGLCFLYRDPLPGPSPPLVVVLVDADSRPGLQAAACAWGDRGLVPVGPCAVAEVRGTGACVAVADFNTVLLLQCAP